MAAILSYQFGKQVCEILGLDPKKVRDMTIHIPVNDAITISVEQYIQDIEIDPLLLLLKKYELHPIEDLTDGTKENK